MKSMVCFLIEMTKCFCKRHPLWAYLVVTYAFSWSIWSILLITYSPDVMQGDIPASFILLAILGGLGPSLAGVVITAIVAGKEGLRDLSARLRRWRVGNRWFAAALLICPLIALATLAFERVSGFPTASLKVMLATLPISIIWPLFAALGEEFGWRGFFLPRLQSQHTAFRASLIVGLTWGLWHLPTVFLAYGQHGLMVVLAYYFVVHVVAITAQSTIMTWIHNNSRQSLLLMILFHFGLTSNALFLFPLNMSIVEGLQHQMNYAVIYWVAVMIVIVTGGLKRKI